MKANWKPFQSKNEKLKKKFLSGFFDEKEAEFWKLISCAAALKCPNSATSSMHIHLNTCRNVSNNSSIPMEQNLTKKEKRTLATQVVYMDNISVITVKTSTRIKTLFEKAGLTYPTKAALNSASTKLFWKQCQTFLHVMPTWRAYSVF